MGISLGNLFIEILVAGLLFTFAISPLVILFSAKDIKKKPGLLPGLPDGRDWRVVDILIAFALIYTSGVAGNRLVEELYHKIEQWAEPKAESKRDPISDANTCDPKNPVFDSKEFYENTEFCARLKFNDWVERHKTYLKVTRAGSFSSILFIFFMTIYRISGWPFYRKTYGLDDIDDDTRYNMYARYGVRYYAMSFLILVLFLAAHHEEGKHFRRDLY